MEITKICTICGEEKEISLFYRETRRKDGRDSDCIACAKAQKKKYRDNNRDKESARTRKYYQENPIAKKRRNVLRYGISMEEYTKMLSEQDNKCLICQKNMEVPFIDHNHITKRVRGLLCQNCNSGLGMFGDSILNLTNAIAYLNSDKN